MSTVEDLIEEELVEPAGGSVLAQAARRERCDGALALGLEERFGE